MRGNPLSALLVCCALAGVAVLLPQSVHADLVRVDLSKQTSWSLTNANASISLPATVPAHTLSVLASAGIIAADPLHRYGERDTRWVGEDTWNFTLVWPSEHHELLVGCRHVVLLLHGIDTYGSVVLNGRRLLEADNAHRSWWLPLSEPDSLREGANMLSVVLHPAAATSVRAQTLYPYPVPTMQVPGGVNSYNFARKPAADFGWDWGPAFVPAGLTGGVELVGFDRATLIGALVTQHFNSSANAFDLTVTAHFVVPAGGDSGTLSLTLAVLDLHTHKEIELQPGVVAGNQLQALVTLHLQVPADRVKLWQPLTLQPKNIPRQLYDLAVMFEPTTVQPEQQAQLHQHTKGGLLQSTCGVAPAHAVRSSGASSSSGSVGVGSGGAAISQVVGGGGPDIRSAIVRRIGFRTVELVQQPIQAARQELLTPPTPTPPQPQQQQQSAIPATSAAAGTSSSVDTTAAAPTQQHQQQSDDPSSQQGESFYFRVNGVPLFAKGANLIPLHVLSTAVTLSDVRALLESAVAANMNMIRIWGGGRYQVDELYEAADELGLMVWQEAMFACSPYPRDAAFLTNVKHEVQQQLLRLGSHASLVVFGGNNEVEQALEWYPDTTSNLPMYTTDYSALFVDTIGRLAQQMLPHTPWVDSSPSKGTIRLPAAPSAHHSTTTQPQQHSTPHHDTTGTSAAQGSITSVTQPGGGKDSVLKRWGNTNDPAFGDIHFYNYVDDCQDWRTYPHARFVSEYGWQSYPSWSTYAAATREEDWALTADMTEYRQRHPNGTVELLAQLQRRFKLPEAWLKLLPQPPDANQQPAQQQQQPTQPAHQQHHAATLAQVLSVSSLKAVQAWRGCTQAVSRLVRHVLSNTLGVWKGGYVVGSADGGSQQPQRTTAGGGSGLVVGTRQGADGDDTVNHVSGGSTSTSTSSQQQHQHQQEQFTDMQHFIYLTQLQQLLCYETALQHWRRLRSDAATLSMGVLYWQLNDLWQGASWSSIDYGGVWKPVHYGVARAFADLSLSVQHDLQQDTITVYAVNDLQQPVQVELAVRLLSVSDTVAHCSGGSGSDSHHQQPPSNTPTDSSGSAQYDAFTAAPYVRHHHMLQAEAPAGAAVRLWSQGVDVLLRKTGHGCSRSSCYVHIALAGEGQPGQEHTVWLAPFSELPLQDPQLAVSDFQPAVSKPAAAAASGAAVSTHQSSSSSSGSSSSSSWQSHNNDGVVTFKVSSQRVAVHAVWETAAGTPSGHFSDNAVTVHPCEPRTVSFVPRSQHGMPLAAAAGVTQGATQQQKKPVAAAAAATQPTDGVGGDDDVASAAEGSLQKKDLSKLLQKQLVVSSLWEHQQFDQQEEQAQDVLLSLQEAKLAAV